MSDSIDLVAFIGSLPRTDGVLNLSPTEAYGLLNRGAALVDMREGYEIDFRRFDVDRIFYLPWSDFADSFDDLPRDESLILADASGIYCREAASLLRQAGYVNIAKLSGGMIDWDRDGLPVRKDAAFELSGQCACKLMSRKGVPQSGSRGGSTEGKR